jgi:hypothetical protein
MDWRRAEGEVARRLISNGSGLPEINLSENRPFVKLLRGTPSAAKQEELKAPSFDPA